MGLENLRHKIDLTDEEILKLLNKRANLIQSIAKIKKEKKLPIYAPDRERDVYEKLKTLNKGPLSDKSLKAIYREIMSSALSLEKPIDVAYLGPELTFTHLAAMEKFGSSVEYTPCKSITDVFSEVEKSRCDYGVVPIENSTEGAVNHTLDMFIDSELQICAEVYLEISLNLLGYTKNLKNIKEVYSNPQVFGQCRVWLENNMPGAILKDTSSTAEAALIVSKKKTAACISSLLAKDKYGLKLLAKSIEDTSHNITRFLVIASERAIPTGRDKTSIMFSIKDRVGALHDILVPFKKDGINLMKIESRPSKLRAWKYYFFVDLEGHIEDKKVQKTLKNLEKDCIYLKILGSYPVSNQ